MFKRYVYQSIQCIDDTLPFSIKNFPKQTRDEIKQQLSDRDNHCVRPKRFKCKNETGIFDALIYLDDHYNTIIEAIIITNKLIISDNSGFMIQNNGKVFYYLYDHSADRRIKTNTGFVFDNNRKEQILDFINEMKCFSKHLRNKYYKNK